MAFPGMTLSPMRVSLGSGFSSGSSTNACLMLIPCSARTLDAYARIPISLGLSAVISTTPSPSCLAAARSDGPADSSFEKIALTLLSRSIVRIVSLTVRRSTPTARGYFESWDLNFINVNPVALDGESILQQELGDLQPLGMSLEENLDPIPH